MRAEELSQDLSFAWRSVRASPGYAAIVVATLALGIAANTLIVSLMAPYLLRELPFEAPESLVQLGQVDPVTGWEGARLSLPMMRDWEERTRSFDEIATYYYTLKNVAGSAQPASEAGSGAAEPERIVAGVLSGNLFDVLGVSALLGRTFGTAESGPGGADVVVLSHGLWLRRYGGDPSIVGSDIRLDGSPFTVIGVMPPAFNFPFGGVKMWIPLRESASSEPRDRDLHIPIGRLKPGVSRERARAELESIQKDLGALFPDVDGRFAGVTVKPLREALNFAYDVMKFSFLVLSVAVFFVLLIACVNVASLTLARASARTREVAVRAALGASRLRLVRQLLMESLLLATLGGILGVLLADWGARLVGAVIPEDLFRVGEVRVDPGVLLFSTLVTLVTPFVFGLGPAVAAVRASLTGSLQASGRAGAGLSAVRFRRALVVGEVAMAIVLVGGAGLMLRSFQELQRIDLGFRPDGVLTVEATLPASEYPDASAQQSFFDRARERIASLPAVRAVGVVAPLPLNHAIWTRQFALAEAAPAERETWPAAAEFRVSPDYFDAMGIALLEGRVFEAPDRPDSEKVVVVGRSLAVRYGSGSSPLGLLGLLGKTILIEEGSATVSATIVGVVADVTHAGLEESSPLQLYRPLSQAPARGRFFVVATHGSPEGATPDVRGALAAVDPNLPLTLRPMVEIVDESTLPWSMSSLLLGIFAAIALALASLGIYGVISYSVATRRRELGLRMALGATGRELRGLVLGEGLRLSGYGLAIGLGLAALVGRLMVSLLYGVGPFDPLTFVTVVGIFLATAVLASLLPARRAARTDPVGVLRCE